LGNFYKGSCGIKFLYRGAGRRFGGGGRICLVGMGRGFKRPIGFRVVVWVVTIHR